MDCPWFRQSYAVDAAPTCIVLGLSIVRLFRGRASEEGGQGSSTLLLQAIILRGSSHHHLGAKITQIASLILLHRVWAEASPSPNGGRTPRILGNFNCARLQVVRPDSPVVLSLSRHCHLACGATIYGSLCLPNLLLSTFSSNPPRPRPHAYLHHGTLAFRLVRRAVSPTFLLKCCRLISGMWVRDSAMPFRRTQ